MSSNRIIVDARVHDEFVERFVAGGLVLPPQVFADVTNDMPIAKNETFGPIAPIIRVRGDAEALRVANDTPYGLSSAVCTADEGPGLRFAWASRQGSRIATAAALTTVPTIRLVERRLAALADSAASGLSRSSPPITG
jgi:acyl-CoA reductase-like NAD-dependent aldehyde dehydrogenase